jgi:nitroreductase
MELLQGIQERAMYRGRFAQRKIPGAELVRLAEAAGWAPSGHNSQAWEFVAVDDDATIETIARTAAEHFDAFLATSDALQEWVRRWMAWLRWSDEELLEHGDGIFFPKWNEQAWRELAAESNDARRREVLVAMFSAHGQPSKLITTAPCLMFTLVNRDRKVPDYSNDMLALTCAGAAMQNLRLAALALGIAVHEQSPLYDLPGTREATAKLLGIPDNCAIVGGMRLGYPTEPSRTLKTHVRRGAARTFHRNRYRA